MFTSLQKLLNKALSINKTLFNKCLFNKPEFLQKKLRHFFRPESDAEIRQLQFFWLVCGGTGILILSYGLVTVLFSASPLAPAEKPKDQPILIESALSKVDIYDAWRHKIEDLLETLTTRTEAVEKLFQEGVKNSDFSQGAPTEEEELEDSLAKGTTTEVQAPGISSAEEESSAIQELRAKVSDLEIRLAQTNNGDSSFSGPQNSNSYCANTQNEVSVIQKVTLGLVAGPHHKQAKTVETTIPAGAFAKTVLLSGLDASSAMNASSDPRPMLLRIIDHGTLPRRFQSDLKDCHCTAGAYGDLSSERVYARLEKLTCVDRKTSEIVELQVSGYVSGSDGKAGIRGIVASKDGQFLARSLMGGVFAGLSNVANHQNRKAQVNPFFGGGAAGSEPSGPSIGENFLGGMASGATTALDRLSQYYIDRAEQLQPVIQIAAGQVVDIVFTEGTSLLSNQSSVISHQNLEDNNKRSSIQHQREKGE